VAAKVSPAKAVAAAEATDVGTTKVSATKVAAAEVGTTKVSATKVSATKVAAAEVGTTKVSATKVAAAEVGAAEATATKSSGSRHARCDDCQEDNCCGTNSPVHDGNSRHALNAIFQGKPSLLPIAACRQI
jgi:hypothetical protein